MELTSILDIDPDASVRMTTDYSACFYESDSPGAICEVTYQETADTVYARQMAEYQERLKAYEKWYKKNEQAILKEMSQRDAEQ